MSIYRCLPLFFILWGEEGNALCTVAPLRHCVWVRQGLPARPLESLLCQPTHSYPPTPVSSVTSCHESRRRCKVESANRLSAQRVRCSRSRINLLPPSINAPRSNSFSQGLSMHRFFHCILSPTAFPPFPHPTFIPRISMVPQLPREDDE